MDVRDISISEIHADPEFNCRNEITALDVVDLARDIDMQGLQNPVVVHQYDDKEMKATGKRYRLISGYRRLKAFQVLERTEIPANVREHMTIVQAQIMNLGENLSRKQLDILEEAKALQRLKNAGVGEVDAAQMLHQSRGWIQVRYMLLTLPEEVQKEAAAGTISQSAIREIYSQKGREKQLALAKEIKEKKQRGEKFSPKSLRPKSAFTRKHRDRKEIFEMMEHIQDNFGNDLTTRALAWCAGEISDIDFYRDLRQRAEDEGKQYEIPKEVLSAVS